MSTRAASSMSSQARPCAGRDAVWAAVRDLARGPGELTSLDVAARAGVLEGTARKHLERLASAGILTKTPGRLRAWPYRSGFTLAVDMGAEAPRVGAAGAIDQTPTSRERLWATMKALGAFSERDLAAATGIAAGPGVRVWLRHLRRVGYLAPVDRGGGATARRRWRLLPHMNTGPQPPVLRHNQLIFDPNLGRQVWPMVPSTLDRRS